ncbi:MAG: threonine/serine exporter family protein, partial [Gemmiger sp.]
MTEHEFHRAMHLVMEAGTLLLESGGEVFRAQDTMEIMAHSLGIGDFHVYVLTNGIFASAMRGSV